MQIVVNINVTLSAFVDKEDDQVCISASVQADASIPLSSLPTESGHPCVQAEMIVDALKLELESKLYTPLWQELDEIDLNLRGRK